MLERGVPVWDLLDRMAADGRLQEYADQAARVIMSTLNALWAFGGQVVVLWNRMAPVIARVAGLLGGWDRLAWFAAAVLMGRLVFGLVSGFLLFARGLFLVGSGLIGMAWHLVRAAVMANPLLAVIAAIAAAAYIIHQNWDGIVAYFRDKIDGHSFLIDRSENGPIVVTVLPVGRRPRNLMGGQK